MIEQEIINRVFARKPFTALEITTSLFPKKQSEYSKISSMLKASYFEISEYYDNIEIDVTIHDDKKHKTVSQTLYYPWEYNPRNYKKEFEFNEKHLSENNFVFVTNDKIKEYELEDETIDIKPVEIIKHVEPKLVKSQPIKPKPVNEIFTFHEKISNIQDTVVIQNTFSEIQYAPKVSEDIVINNKQIEIESAPKIEDTPLIKNTIKEESTINQIVESPKIKNEIKKSEITTPATEVAVNNIHVSSIPITPIKKAITSIGEFTIKQTDYKQEIIILRSQTTKLGIHDINYSVSCSNKRIILNVQENGPLRSDERGLKINKSFLDLAGLSGNVSVTVFSDKSLMYTQV